MRLRIFTDGACSGNPGPGGWAALFAYKDSLEIISGHEVETTNNRMELLAVVSALESANKKTRDKMCQIQIYADSAYVVNTIQMNWLWAWLEKGWKTSSGKDVKNRDLWERLLQTMSSLEQEGVAVEFTKVKGHAGNLLNGMADEKAREESNIAKRKAEGK